MKRQPLIKYQGPSHAQGGIQIENNKEVEGGETRHKDYVYSNRLKGSKGKTMAGMSEQVAYRYKKKRETDYLAGKSLQAEMNDVKYLNDRLREQSPTVQPEKLFRGGYTTDPLQVKRTQSLGTDGTATIANSTPVHSTPSITPSALPPTELVSKRVRSLSPDGGKMDMYNYNTSPLQPTQLQSSSIQSTTKDLAAWNRNRLMNPDNMPQIQKPDAIDNMSKTQGMMDKVIGAKDKLGMAAAITPMLVSSFRDLTRPSEQAKLFQNNEYYQSLDLMRENRIDSDALINSTNRQANAVRRGNASRSAQVNNALNTNIGANTIQAIQNIKLEESKANNQYRAQEAQTRATLGAQDREYRNQQDITQSQNDGQQRNLQRQAAQTIWNLVGENINNRVIRDEAVQNQAMLKGMDAQMQISAINAVSEEYGINQEVAQQMVDRIMLGDYKNSSKVVEAMRKRGLLQFNATPPQSSNNIQ